MIRRVGIAALAVAVLALCGLLLLARRSEIGPLGSAAQASFPAADIAQGAALAAAGHCASCHTQTGGPVFAGGYAVNTPFGKIYGSNITPDPATGIGLWPLEAFTRAMREGVSRDGSHLFPAFPYYAYTKLSDSDIRSLYAFLMTRTAVRASVPGNTLPFPLRIRAFQEGWKILFFQEGRYQPNRARSDEWNRGAYLAEGLADCSGCHTPRNALGGEESRRAYAGAGIDGWIAPALNSANPSPIPWTREELFQFLRTGSSPLHGATSSTMTAVIRDSLALPIVPDSDIRAIAAYFIDADQANPRAEGTESRIREALATSSLGSGQEDDPDAALYAAACIACHYNASSGPLAARPELALNSSLTMPDPANFIQVVLQGVGSTDGAPGLVMPGFASSLTDAEIARLAAYLRRTRTKLPPWRDLESRIRVIRRTAAKQE
ncbi:c-type cytochrome [Paludibaculum fermentans]|uniref:C-type cytochrome n=1 Tax=Paludibaculum fermentans TaxID=1473598 RepID=A0A7S7SMV0_PALFE|nr:cytochrome c [Paludibaculum fermentans]QOY89871.1 c-type cytochrome [Paludibaculum fermentans]